MRSTALKTPRTPACWESSQQEAEKETGCWTDRSPSLKHLNCFPLTWQCEGIRFRASVRAFSLLVSLHEFKKVVDKMVTRPEVENCPGRAEPCLALGGYAGNAVYKLCLWSIWIVIASYRIQHSLLAHSLQVPVCLNTLTALMKQTGLNISLSLNRIHSQAYLLQSPLKLCSDPFLCLQLALLPTTQASHIHLHTWYSNSDCSII